MNLEKKINEDYNAYLVLCDRLNEEPRSQSQDFYKHRNWLLKQNKINA